MAKIQYVQLNRATRIARKSKEIMTHANAITFGYKASFIKYGTERFHGH